MTKPSSDSIELMHYICRGSGGARPYFYCAKLKRGRLKWFLKKGQYLFNGSSEKEVLKKLYLTMKLHECK